MAGSSDYWSARSGNLISFETIYIKTYSTSGTVFVGVPDV